MIRRIQFQLSLYPDQVGWLKEYSAIRREAVSLIAREMIDEHKRRFYESAKNQLPAPGGDATQNKKQIGRLGGRAKKQEGI